MNKSEKGRRKELQVLHELVGYYLERGIRVIDTWHTNRSHFGANDFMGYDIALKLDMGKPGPVLVLVQVKSEYSPKDLSLLERPQGCNAYYAVYSGTSRHPFIELPHSKLFLV